VPPAGLGDTATLAVIIRREGIRAKLRFMAGAGAFVLFSGVVLALASTSFPLVGGAPPTPAVALNGWYDDGGDQIITALQTDLQSINDAVADDDLAGVATACGKLRDDVATAQRSTPMPDALASSHFSGALSHFARGSLSCVDAIRTKDTTLMSSAGYEFKAGNDEFDRLAARLGQVRGD
jgi:hypothetical protein